MPTLVRNDAASPVNVATWTAAEVFASIAPTAFSRLHDPAAVLRPMTLEAHAIAVQRGFEWNIEGRYPISVWQQVYR